MLAHLGAAGDLCFGYHWPSGRSPVVGVLAGCWASGPPTWLPEVAIDPRPTYEQAGMTLANVDYVRRNLPSRRQPEVTIGSRSWRGRPTSSMAYTWRCIHRCPSQELACRPSRSGSYQDAVPASPTPAHYGHWLGHLRLLSRLGSGLASDGATNIEGRVRRPDPLVQTNLEAVVLGNG